MPRKLRLEFPDACYHVINRGNYRRDLFAGKGSAEAFERTLFETCARFGWRLHAFIIMRNHFHLTVETPEPNLSDGMKWLQGTWAMRFNRFRGESGRPFQGRYKATHVEPGHVLAQVAHYIHLNPVKAKVLPAARLQEFRWSSLWHYLRRDRPECLNPATVLDESGSLPDTKGGWKHYLRYLALLAEENPAEREKLHKQLSRGWYVGSKEFREDLKKDLKKRGADLEKLALLGGWRAAWQEEREAEWEQRLQAAAKIVKVDLKKLAGRKSAPEKVLLAALLKATSAASNSWLAARLGMGQPASVSQFVRRFRLSGGENKHGYKRILSRVKT
jgi:putative transposase